MEARERSQKARKRDIRINIHNIVETKCKGCKFNVSRFGWKNDTCLSQCPIGQDLQKEASKLVTDEKLSKAPNRKSSHPVIVKGRWSDEEIFYLINHAEHFHVMHLAAKLGRSTASVFSKIYMLRGKRIL